MTSLEAKIPALVTVDVLILEPELKTIVVSSPLKVPTTWTSDVSDYSTLPAEG